MKALIFAAGKGTRLKPFTDNHPKALAKVNGKALLQRNIEYLKSYGISDFVINIHHFGSQIISFLKHHANFGVRIQISDEHAALLETGGGLVFARQYLDDQENFLIMNADILTDLNISDFVNHHIQKQHFVTLAVSDRNSSRKLIFNENNILQGWRNLSNGETKGLVGPNKELTELAFSGIHCVNHSIFDKIQRQGQFSIMEEYLNLMSTEKLYGYQHNSHLIDVGKPEAIQKAEKIFL